MKNLFLISLLSLSLTACFSSAPGTSTKVTTTASPAKFAAKASDLTAFQFYRLMAANPENVNFSPISMDMAFALVYPGSDGATQKLFEKIFGFNAGTPNPYQAEYGLAAKMQAANNPYHQLLIANSGWVSDSKMISDGFKESLKVQNAEINKLDLTAMNEWVASATKNKIPKLLDQLDPQVTAIFINAIYFKQKWLIPFEFKNSKLDDFHADENVTEQVRTMHFAKDIRYSEDALSKWISLGYEGAPFAMYFILPQKRYDLKSVEDKLSPEYFAQMSDKMTVSSTEVALPKFKFDQKKSLKEFFITAGYGEIFTQGNYSKIGERKNFNLSDVIQATTIEVSEEGTEASAATGVVMMKAMAVQRPVPVNTFIADQPFLFILRNETTKEIYWIGKVYSPVGARI